jgi:hypothetical protein
MTSATPQTLEYQLEQADLEAFAAHHVAHAASLARRIRRMRIVWTVVFVVIVVEYARTSPAGAFAFAAVAIAYLALYGPLNRFLAGRQTHGLNRRPPTPRSGGVRLTLQGGALAVEAAEGTGRFVPRDVGQIDETPSHYYLHVGPSSAIIIPRSGLATGDPDAFVRALRAAAEP